MRDCWPWHPRPPKKHLVKKHFGIPLRYARAPVFQGPGTSPSEPPSARIGSLAAHHVLKIQVYASTKSGKFYSPVSRSSRGRGCTQALRYRRLGSFKGIPKWFFGKVFCEAWGAKAKKPLCSLNWVFFGPCHPRPPKTTWSKTLWDPFEVCPGSGAPKAGDFAL